MNAAGNFYTHICEGCTPEELEASNRERASNRGVPYLFLKPARGAVIGTGENIVIPEGRNRTDWEIEFGTVIGRTGKYIPAEDAQDYSFRLHGDDRHLRPGRTAAGRVRFRIGLVRW